MWESVKRFKAGNQNLTLWKSQNENGRTVYTSTIDHESGAMYTPNHNPNQCCSSMASEIAARRAGANTRF